MKILVVGSGGREHALAWKLAQSPKVKEMYAAPGNAGMADIANIVDTKADDVDGLLKFARDNRIDLTVVGPEQPLANGIVDTFLKNGLTIFGPNQRAAEIESSKIFSATLMEKHGIPTAKSAAFNSYEKASEYLKKQKPPYVIKADGLAAGKGVIVSESQAESLKSLSSMMKSKSFGKAGDRVLIQEHLEGREMSFFVFTDGKTVAPTVPACDYKRIFDGNQGPNTGGMGSYSPPQFFNKALGKIIMKTIMEPAVLAMADEKRPYTGALYGGLMIENKLPKVIEFNARLGDPEAQVVLPRLKTDLLEILLAVVENRLGKINIEFHNNACVGVVMASGGYPGAYKTGFPITGLNDLDKKITVFHAGTRISPEGEMLTSGGRVLTIVATGRNLGEARKRVYKNINKIKFENCYYRKDIALFK